MMSYASGSPVSLWGTADGQTWQRKHLYSLGTAYTVYGSFNHLDLYDDGTTLYIPNPNQSSSFNPASNTGVGGIGSCMGWSTTDMVTFTPIKNGGAAASGQGSRALVKFNGLYLAVSLTISSSLESYGYSTDGLNWTLGDISIKPGTSTSDATQRANIRNLYGFGKFVYANGRIYAFYDKGGATSTSNYYYYSTDGITWTEGSMPGFNTSSNAYNYVVYRNGIFLVAGSTSTATAGQPGMRLSTDGINWTTVNQYAGATTITNFSDVAAI
jgi:hypothetical protein